MKFLIKILVHVFTFSTFVFAQGNIEVNSKVDQNQILIGDIVTYSVIIKHDPDIELVMPSLAQNLGMFEIREYEVVEPKKENGQIVEQTDYKISTFDTGEYEIPALEIGYKVSNDSTLQSIKTEPIIINVASLNPDEAGDIRDIKPPLAPARDYKTLMFWSVIGVLSVLLVAFVIYYIKRKRQGKSIIPRRIKPPRPAHEIALEALEELKNSELVENGKVKEYYTIISDIIRQYVENRFFIYAMEMTTTQLLQAMAAENLDNNLIEQMSEFLSRCDFVKFAKYIPAGDENEKTMQMAFDFVERTKLVIYEEQEAKQEDIKEEIKPLLTQDVQQESMEEEQRD